jgi:Asp-tRNA(Asn)/Glu-tRNA(Gln) amidotransferase A subunit family amidase
MRKPINPLNNGLKEPKQVLSKTDHIYLADFDKNERVSLQTVLAAWHKALKDVESQGHRVTESPYFDSSSYYGHGVKLTYTYEWDNLNYPVEKAAYDAALAAYEEEKKAYAEWEAGKPTRVVNLDYKIERAKQRLANLEAVKAGQPLPFPEPP